MMEGVVLPPERALKDLPARDWAVGGMATDNVPRESRHITSINLIPEELEAKTRKRFARYEEIKAKETRYEYIGDKNADLTLVAYGTSARVCLGAKMLAEKQGIKLGLFRPITLWPFPYKALGAVNARHILTVEMSLGQLVEDVKLSIYEAAVNNRGSIKSDVHLLGHSGGVIPTEEEVFAKVKAILGRA
jgi:2-oxoglutarate ferredoxin oxidoreductase subunit alpha